MATGNPGQRSRYRGWLAQWLGMILLALPLISCTSIRPVVKIGLLAPFEGLERETGYLALAAMRSALVETPRGPIEFLPLALDASADPARAAQKLLVDPQVQAVIGPFSPQAISEVQGLQNSLAGLWLVPLTIDPLNVHAPWDSLIATVAEQASQQGAERLLLAGWPRAWWPLLEPILANAGTVPIVIEDDPTAAQPHDAIFYGGGSSAAASYLQTLRQTQREIPFFLGPLAESSVFTAHSPNLAAAYAVAWHDAAYPNWAAEHEPSSPLAYWVYRATQIAIAELTETPLTVDTTWSVHIQPLTN